MAKRPDQFVELLGDREAAGEEWNEQPVVADFDDEDAEYWAIRRDGAGLVDRMARGTLVITGEEAVPWLQGLVTSDLLDLQEPGAGLWTTATDVNGRIVADLRVLHVPEMLVVDVEPGVLQETLYAHLDQQIIMEDVELSDRSASTGRIGVFGADASEIIEEAGTWEASIGGLAAFDGTWGRMDGRDVIVQHIRWVGEPGFQLTIDREAAADVWRALERAGGERIQPAGATAVETARIEAGVPRYGEELDDDVIPLEAGLRDQISFEKGCYTGQEVIARLDTLGEPAKKLRTLVFDGGAAPRIGASVEREGREVGDVASSVWSPLMETPIALAFVKRGAYQLGETVEVEGREAEVRELGEPMRRN